MSSGNSVAPTIFSSPVNAGSSTTGSVAFNEVIGRSAPPDVVYNLARLSSRTTFDAVTHALMTTELTDESGQSLGTALDLVAQLETIKGKIKGAGGDQQFRISAVLKPDAREIMERSQQFQRKGDNTIYHKGYPVNYRQTVTAPSIQVSIARDEPRRYRRRLPFF